MDQVEERTYNYDVSHYLAWLYVFWNTNLIIELVKSVCIRTTIVRVLVFIGGSFSVNTELLASYWTNS